MKLHLSREMRTQSKRVIQRGWMWLASSSTGGRAMRAKLRNHTNTILRSQRNLRLNLQPLPRNQPQPPALRDRCQQLRALHPRKGLANALAAARTEREVDELRPAGLAFRRKAFRIEPQRIGKMLSAALNNVLTEEEIGPGRQLIRPQRHITRSLPPHRPRRRI